MPSLPLQTLISEGSSVDTETRLLTVKFGDGYNQRTADGINHNQRRMKVIHKYLSASDATTLRTFYETNSDGTSIDCATRPTDGTTRNWYIESWSESIEAGGFLHNFTSELVELFE
jgi:phage-related protein